MWHALKVLSAVRGIARVLERFLAGTRLDLTPFCNFRN
jgi:hypothetical protein